MRIILLCICPLLWLPASGQQEAIRQFVTHLEVAADGSVEVTEDITVVATGDIIKRGITRALHREAIGAGSAARAFTYDILEVLRDGQPIDHSTARKGRNEIVYLGSKSETIPPGEYTYRLRYRSPKQVYFQDSLQEIRWPFIGVDGALPTRQGTITVTLPPGASLLAASCYTGREGTAGEDCKVQRAPRAATFTLRRPLAAGEGMTVAVGVPAGTFTPPPAPAAAPPPTRWQRDGTLYLSLLGLLLALGYGYTTWRRHGVDPQGPEVRPRFGAPEGLSPAAAAYLLTGMSSQQQVTASLTALAIGDHLRIEEEEKAGILGLGGREIFVLYPAAQSQGREALPPEQRVLLDQLRGYGGPIELDGDYNEDLHAMTKAHNEALAEEHAAFMADGRNTRFVWPLVGILLGSLAAAAFFLGTSDGKGIVAFAVLAVTALGGPFFFNWLVRQPSAGKVALKNELKGLRQYLKMKESQRRRLLNAPAMTQEHFRELLPYAIALGINNNWAADLAADWGGTAERRAGNHHYAYFAPGFGRKMGSAYAGTAHRASSGGGGGSYSGGGGSVGGGGGTGGF